MFNGFSHSVMGASHEAKNIVCQDSSAHKVHDKYAICVVADGHGSKKHFRSNIGSKCAVEATVETIERFYENVDEIEANLPTNSKLIIRNIEKQIIAAWNTKVNEHLKNNPVTEEERAAFTTMEFEAIPAESYYGTTLIAAVIGRDYTFGLQIGDGSLVAIFEDAWTIMPMDYEEANPANITASMCNSNAASMFDSFYKKDKVPLALFASTDGLYTSFGSDVDFLDYHTIVCSQLGELKTFEPSILKNLQKRSHFGTEDDISLSCVFNDDLLAAKLHVVNDKVAENRERAKTRKNELMRDMNKQKNEAVKRRAEELHKH